MFLFVLFFALATENDAFATQNSHRKFLDQRPIVSTRHCRILSNGRETLLWSSSSPREGDSQEKQNAELFLLEYSIDSFLRGDYDRSFSEDAASPLPGLSPSDTVDAALRSLRDLDEPEPFHGAAVFLRFCAELGRGERWGTTTSSSSSWTELLRGALTPTMMARRIRASEDFSALLDWSRLEVIEDGDSIGGSNTTVFRNDNVAFVEAALYFGYETSKISPPPQVYRFELAKMLGGVWLIQSVEPRKSPTGVANQSISTSTKRSKNPPLPTRKKGQGGGQSRRPPHQRGKPKRQQGKPKSGDKKRGGPIR